jgi:hypothetical protein
VKTPDALTLLLFWLLDEASRARDTVEVKPTCRRSLARWARKPALPIGANHCSPLLPLALSRRMGNRMLDEFLPTWLIPEAAEDAWFHNKN